MTPSHDPSRTPSHGGSAWDPSSAATPARSTDDFDYTGSYDTPSPAGVSVVEPLYIRNAIMAVMYHNRYDIKFHVSELDNAHYSFVDLH